MSPENHMKIVSRSEAQQIRVKKHAAHCMVYALTDSTVLGGFKAKAHILMQIRFDGLLRFPGGFIDDGESWEEGLKRELLEEAHLEAEISPNDYVYSVHDQKSGFMCHFYTLKISESQFHEIERRIFDAKHYGHEVLGITRVPLFVRQNKKGMPTFLQHQFVGCAREQLLKAIEQLGIMTKTEIDHMLKLADQTQ